MHLHDFSALAQNREFDHVIDCDILDRLAIRASCRLFACVNQPDKSETLQRRCPDLRRQFVECLLRQVGGGGNERGGGALTVTARRSATMTDVLFSGAPAGVIFKFVKKPKTPIFSFPFFLLRLLHAIMLKLIMTVARNSLKLSPPAP